ncbi:ATP-grasp domain-containing protein [Candidatus Thorarchaeota archaeon]|nr:MAG: ATP-grasp domain-containing protein [Candidatus Thorarchaeota archaeon]
MARSSSSLNGKKIGVIGFNARPIAKSLKLAGAETYVSDYWGDLDLKSVSDACIAVLTPVPDIRQRKQLNVPLHQALLDNYLELTKETNIDHVIIGSGFDDHSDILEPLEKCELLLGCNIRQMKNARDRAGLRRMIEDLDVKMPRETMISSAEEIESKAVQFPCIVRKKDSGGGSGIRLVHNKNQLRQKMLKNPPNEEIYRPIIQQYISGKDISCSVLGTGKESAVLSIQGQLIGMPTAGRNCDFAYCGNYLPIAIESKYKRMISEISKKICNRLHLRGSIGIDYLLDTQGDLWLMEINPRFQGTLEILEIAGDISVTSLHFEAIQGELPSSKFKFRPATKMIVYSRKDGVISDISNFSNVVDISPPGIVVKRGDPICTILEAAETISQCYCRASNIALEIQRDVSVNYDVL